MVTLKGYTANMLGLSTNQKPTNVDVNTIIRELDTNKFYYFDGTDWNEIPNTSGESSDYAVDIEFAMNSQTFVVTAQLKNKDGDLIGTPKSVDIPLESTVVNGSYNNATKTLTLTLVSGQSINIPIGDIISGLQAEITVQNPLNADLVDDTNSTHKFVTASEKAQIATNADDIANAESKIYDLAEDLGTKLPDKGNHTTINGIDVYVSNTQPTGTIRENSIGFGW